MRSFIILIAFVFISLTVNGQVNKIEIDTTTTDVTIVNNGTLIENGTVVINDTEGSTKVNIRDWIWYALIITMVLALAIGIVCEGDGGCVFGIILLIALTVFILRYYVGN